MSHPQMTALIATQRCHDLNRSAQQARRVKQANVQHGVRVVHRASAPQAPGGIWTRVVSLFEKTPTMAPAPKPKLA